MEVYFLNSAADICLSKMEAGLLNIILFKKLVPHIVKELSTTNLRLKVKIHCVGDIVS